MNDLRRATTPGDSLRRVLISRWCVSDKVAPVDISHCLCHLVRLDDSSLEKIADQSGVGRRATAPSHKVEAITVDFFHLQAFLFRPPMLNARLARSLPTKMPLPCRRCQSRSNPPPPPAANWLTQTVRSSPLATKWLLSMGNLLGYNSAKQVAARRSLLIYENICVPRADEEAKFWKNGKRVFHIKTCSPS
jgi:hypothetical protein